MMTADDDDLVNILHLDHDVYENDCVKKGVEEEAKKLMDGTFPFVTQHPLIVT